MTSTHLRPFAASIVISIAALLPFAPAAEPEQLDYSDPAYDGVYFGSFNGDGGQWALVSRETTGFHFVGFLAARRQLIVGSPYYYDIVHTGNAYTEGHFWDWGPYGFEGRIRDGRVTGTAAFQRLEPVYFKGEEGPSPYSDASFSGARDVSNGPVSIFMGGFSWSDDKPSLFGRTAYAFVGPSGKALVFVQDADQGGADCGVGTIDAAGNLSVSFAFGNRAIARIVAGKLIVDIPPAPQRDLQGTEKPVSQLVNFSTRAHIPRNNIPILTRLFVAGSGSPVLIRATGPGLQPFLPNTTVADDPRLGVSGNSGALMEFNDNWENTPRFVEAFGAAGAFPLNVGSNDAAVLTTLTGSNIVSVASPTAGVGLIEAFDLQPNENSRFISFSTRHYTGGETADPVIAGFVIKGTGVKTVLVRGLGPALGHAPFNVADMRYEPDTRVSFLADTSISVYRSDGQRLAANDDWPSSLAPVFEKVGASPLPQDSKDAALLLDLQPGAYTVILHGAGVRVGGCLLEIFEVD